jgi:hypothetical protein
MMNSLIAAAFVLPTVLIILVVLVFAIAAIGDEYEQ